MHDPVWDAELGVWKGEMAAGLHVVLPTPLYIFGYGSLIWNPGPFLKHFDSYHCSAIGWKRLFAQRSSDHRGTVQFPGLVLNLVDDSCLSALNYSNETPNRSECFGMIWYVPGNMVSQVVADLDYRERGGYCRQIVQVQLQEDTIFHKKDEIVDALVYTGPRSNPNFYLPARSLPDSASSSDLFGLSTRNAVIDIIAAAIGPSGANIDYLFNLERYLHERGMVDTYLVELADCVRRRVGPWIARRHLQHLHESSRFSARGAGLVISGWGSNEFLQLRYALGGENEYCNELHAHHYWATRLSSSRNNTTQSSIDDVCSVNSHVSAGGGTSSILHSDGTLTLWGKLLPSFLQHITTSSDTPPSYITLNTSHNIRIAGVDCISIGHDHCLLLLCSGHVVGFGSNSHGQLAGLEKFGSTNGHGFYVQSSDVVLELVDGNANTPTYKIQSRCCAQRDAMSAGVGPKTSILKVAVGLRHSAAITQDGRLITWGDSLHGQCLQRCEDDSVTEEPVSWSPPGEAVRLIDVACGARFTLVVDSEGHIYSLGSDKHGCLSRRICSEENEFEHKGRPRETKSAVPGGVEGLPEGVRWQRVVCGWSHAVARGILPNGQLVFWTWGRCDMGQCLSVATSLDGERVDGRVPHAVRSLPNGLNIAEVWAGSEYTVVCDDEGKLWGCGWNEHGNLGNGDVHCKNALEDWQPAVERSNDGSARHVRLACVWEGAAACGGGHTLCIEQN